MKITKATEQEKIDYRYGGYKVYPLYGFVRDNGFNLAIEFPNEIDGPRYEVMAPEGYHFFAEGTHTLLCTTLADIRSRVGGDRLTPCTDECNRYQKVEVR